MSSDAEYDVVNKPQHYVQAGRKFEPIDVIEDWRLGYHLGNVVKYISRWEIKGGVESLKKARFYLDRFIKAHESS